VVFESSPLQRLRFPLPVPIREVWPSEALDFTPWLAANLQVLDVLQLGRLECVGQEVAIPGTGRALDILARAPTGDVVAIENQYGKADHDHLTRGLAYSVGLNARALVVVAEAHLGEFRAVAGYLNRLAEQASDEQGVGVFLVEIEVEAIEEYLVPRFRILEAPNEFLHRAAGLQPPPAIAGPDEFLAASAESARSSFKSVIDWWTSHDVGSARFGSQYSASLDRPHPLRPSRPLSHMLLNTNGTFTVQRGYLREAGLVTDEEVGDFDDMLRKAFPSLTWSGKQYFVGSTTPPPIAGVELYWKWLENHSSPTSVHSESQLNGGP
jgi:hypothetical protein